MLIFIDILYFIFCDILTQKNILDVLIVEMHAMEEIKRGRGRPRTKTVSDSGVKVQALDRGALLLKTLALHNAISLSDLAEQVGLPASSAHRLLMTLQQHDFVDFDENTQLWHVGIEAYRVGSAYLNRTNFIEAARKPMRKLMANTGETANLAVIDNTDLVFVAQAESNHPVRAFFNAGTRALMHASGIGKALLAQMPKRELEALIQSTGLPEYTMNTLINKASLYEDLELTLKRGYSFDQEERYEGMSCVGAAICSAKGELVGGISVSGPSVRFSPSQVAVIGLQVKAAADQVTLTLGGKL
jgi:IclR family acetate operon transcriptional repressor